MPPNDRQSDEFRSLKDQLTRVETVNGQHSSQITTLQNQLSIMVDLTTRFAVWEERREQDRDNIKLLFSQVEGIRGRVDVLHTSVTSKFPIYDSLNEVYKTLNAKLWTAIFTGVLGLLLSGSKLMLGN